MIGSFFVALRRLSVLPLGERADGPAGREGDAVALFPLAGLAIAVPPAAVLVVAGRIFEPPLPAALAVAALALVTGARHLGELGRTAGAIFSERPALGALEVMREERVTAVGATAVTLALLLKLSALASLGGELGGSNAGQVCGLLLAVCLARWAGTVLAVYSDYARPEGGSDEPYIAFAGGREARWALAVAVAAVLALGLGPVGWWRALLAAAGCALFAWGAALFFARRFGGATGECMGAVIEAAEVLVLVLMCALPAWRPEFNPVPERPAAVAPAGEENRKAPRAENRGEEEPQPAGRTGPPR